MIIGVPTTSFDGIDKDHQPNGNGRKVPSHESILQEGDWAIGRFLGS
jgi:hypothetical protein